VVVAAPPVREAAVPVVLRPAAVQGDADRDPELVEDIAEPLVQKDGVGLDAELQRADPVEFPA
jgi:hypothetical protein